MSRLPSRLRALGELRGARETILFAYLSVFALSVPLMMRLSLPRLATLLTRAPRRQRPSPEAVDRLAALVGLAQRVGRPFVRGGCLTRGVTLFWFLRRAGLDVELCFGLSALEDDVDGHCWLTVDGEPFLERVDPRPRFPEVYRLPPLRA